MFYCLIIEGFPFDVPTVKGLKIHLYNRITIHLFNETTHDKRLNDDKTAYKIKFLGQIG